MQNRDLTFKFLVLVIIALCLSTNGFAGGTGKISGRVIDAKSGDALPGANVVITAVWQNGNEVPLNNLIGAATDIDGNYFIINLDPGKYSVTASYVGYRKQKITEVNVNADQTTKVDFKLQLATIQSKEVLVTGYVAPKVEADRTSTKQIYNIPTINGLAGINDIGDILNLQADVVDNHFRGGREGETLYLLGGASINNPLSSQRSFSPIVSGLKQVQIITSGFSAEFGNAQSGVVNMIPREGGDKWETEIGYSIDLPHYDTWGGDPFSNSYMPFWSKLSNYQEWLKLQDPSISKTGALFDSFEDISPDFWPNGFSGTRADSIRLAKFAMQDWMTIVRDMGLKYSFPVQNRLDISVGGPISERFAIFTAARQTTSTPIIPTPLPDKKRQWLSNFTAHLDKSNKLVLSFSYNDQYKNKIDHVDSWFDRIFQVTKMTDEEKLLSLNYNHIFSHASFMDVSLSALNTLAKTRPEFIDPGRYRVDMANGETRLTQSPDFVGRARQIPSGQQQNNVELDRSIEETNTYSLNASYTSQINDGNLIKTGVQFSTYLLRNLGESNIKSASEAFLTDFHAYPYEGAWYAQDKMEFQGMIANFGLRFDFYDFNTSYYKDIFRPRKDAPTDHTKPFYHLAPRLGISFPISETSVFHLNYGSFVQRPQFDQIFNTEWASDVTFNKLGNPKLKPEKTNSYDVGIEEGLPFGMTLGLSAYYKDVKDLVHEAYYISNSQSIYLTYGNLDYANIRGFHVNLEKSGKIFDFYINYNYQVATGKASSPSSDNTVKVYENPELQNQRKPKDINLDFNRTHRIVANVRFNIPDNFGPSIFGTHPFADVSISTTLKVQTGRPYTYDVNHLGLINNMFMPTEYDLRLKLQKQFKISSIKYTIYIEGYNLLNLKVFDTSVFDQFNELKLLQRYKDGQRGQLIWYDPNYYGTMMDYEYRYPTSMEQQIYDNTPRYFRVGLKIDI